MLSNLTRWVAPEGQLRRRRLGVVVAVLYVIFVATYLPINFFSIGRQASTLFLPGEARIPFVPQFEFLYILGYLVPLLAVFRLPSVRHFHRLLVAFGLTLAVAYATYVLFPVYLERPVVEVDSLATLLVALEYHDPSYNHFPSLHVAVTWLIGLACRKALRHPVPFFALLVGIAVSALFIKQHYVVDLVYGIGLACAAWAVTRRLTPATSGSGAEAGMKGR